MININADVDILMATYNGEKYIRQQIDSILNQTYKNFNLIIRDDGSKDNTVKIINEYEEKDKRITTIVDNKRNLGVARNFEELLKNSSSNYSMFCDHDDIWNNDKVKISIEAMTKMEKSFTNEIPILIHTDLEVLDEKNIKTGYSIYKILNRNPKSKVNKWILENIFFGCTLIINKKLKDMSLPFPKEVMAHDVWIPLLSDLAGKRLFINTPTIKYRQHENNVSGSINKRKKKLNLILNGENKRKTDLVRKYTLIRHAFNRVDSLKKNDEEKKILLDFEKWVETRSRCKRLFIQIKRRFFYNKISTNFKFFIKNLIFNEKYLDISDQSKI